MELGYIFGSPFSGISTDAGAQEGYSDVDRYISRHIMQLWTNFAKFGSHYLSHKCETIVF